MADTPELYSVNQFTGNGTQNQYEISFSDGYLSEDDVYARIYADATLASYIEPTITFIGEFQVQLSPTPAFGTIVRIYRQTKITEPVVDFSDGSIVNEINLDTNARQAVMLAQETRDAFGLSAEIDGIPALINDMEEALEELADAFDNATFTGITNFAGARPFQINTESGQVGLKGDAGGWNLRYSFLASNNTNVGGFGAVGSGIGLSYLYVGSSYDDRNALRWQSSGPSWEDQFLVSKMQDRAVMKAAWPTVSRVVLLDEAGRRGRFTCRAGSPPVSDPSEGLYVVSNTAGFYWEREWDQTNGRPEWFGAVTNSNAGGVAAANRVAIQACIILCPVVQFAPKDYYVDTTVVFGTSFRTYRGSTAAWDATGKGTRIISNSLVNNVVNVTGATDMVVENISAMFNGTPTVPSPGSEITSVKNWEFTNTTSVKVYRLSAFNGNIGFIFNNNVAITVDDSRSYAPALFGFWAYDTGSHVYAGANASIYLSRCNVTNGGNVGFFANGDFADLVLTEFETSGTPKGILLDGTGSTYSGGHGDVRIVQSTIDTATKGALEIKNVNSLAKIQINGGYYQLNDDGTTQKCVWVHNGGGYITFTGVQLTGTGSSTTSIGLRIDAQPNVVVDDSCIIENFPFPMDIINGCARPKVTCHIQAGQLTGGHTALTIDNAGQGYIAPVISGSPGAFGTAINLNSTTNTRMTVELGMVDLGCCARKITSNGVTITVPGFYKTNGTSGAYTDNGAEIRGFTA